MTVTDNPRTAGRYLTDESYVLENTPTKGPAVNDTRIHWSELDQKFWINDNDDLLWFESPLDAKDAIREKEVRDAVNAEVQQIADWFRLMGLVKKAAAIEAREYKHD